jgi:hypothetical protein
MLLVVGGQDIEPEWGGSPRASCARSELKWPCDGSSGWVRSNSSSSLSHSPRPALRLATSGVVSSSLLREAFPGSRIKVHRQHSRMAPPSGSHFRARPWSFDQIAYADAADLYQTSASTKSPGVPRESRSGGSVRTPLQSHYLPTIFLRC